MNLNLKYDIGDMVYLIYDMSKRQSMIIGAEIYADGGFNYKIQYMKDDGCVGCSYHFENELEKIE